MAKFWLSKSIFMSKIIRIFLKKNFVKEYDFRGTLFVIDIFWKLHFLNHSIFWNDVQFLTTFTQLNARLKNFLRSWLLVLGLKECLVECATLCVKSEVILNYICRSHSKPLKRDWNISRVQNYILVYSKINSM